MHRLLFNTSNAEDVSSVFSLPTETSDISSFRFIRISRYNMNTYPIWLSTLEIDRRGSGSASLRYRNRPGTEHCSYVWTEFLSGMVFVPARELSGIEVWTKSLLKTFLTLVKLGQYFFARDVFLIVRLINKIELILLLNHTGPLFIN